jgi:hypothetical protein
LKFSLLKPAVVAREGLNPVNLEKRRAYASTHYDQVALDAVGNPTLEAEDMKRWRLKEDNRLYIYTDESGFNLNATQRKHCRLSLISKSARWPLDKTPRSRRRPDPKISCVPSSSPLAKSIFVCLFVCF